MLARLQQITTVGLALAAILWCAYFLSAGRPVLAGLGAFVKDLGQIIGFLLTIWFFLTPICYTEDKLHAQAAFLSKNPIFILVRGYRSILLEHHAPDFGPLWKLWLVSLIIFILGHAWFYKLRKSFADMI